MRRLTAPYLLGIKTKGTGMKLCVSIKKQESEVGSQESEGKG